jgi:transposase
MNAGIGIDVSKKYLDVAEHGDRAVERFANSKAGIKLVVKWIAARTPVQILIEATGGYELDVLKALVGVGLPAAQINPRQVRDFAKALGQLSKTDVLDARVLAHFAEVKTFPVYVPPTPEQYELSQCCLRREHIKKLKQAESQRLRCFADTAILAAMRGLIKSFAKQIKALDQRMGAAGERTPGSRRSEHHEGRRPRASRCTPERAARVGQDRRQGGLQARWRRAAALRQRRLQGATQDLGRSKRCSRHSLHGFFHCRDTRPGPSRRQEETAGPWQASQGRHRGRHAQDAGNTQRADARRHRPGARPRLIGIRQLRAPVLLPQDADHSGFWVEKCGKTVSNWKARRSQPKIQNRRPVQTVAEP